MKEIRSIGLTKTVKQEDASADKVDSKAKAVQGYGSRSGTTVEVTNSGVRRGSEAEIKKPPESKIPSYSAPSKNLANFSKSADNGSNSDTIEAPQKRQSQAEKELEELRNRGLTKVYDPSDKDTSSSRGKNAAEEELEKLRSLGLTKTLRQEDGTGKKESKVQPPFKGSEKVASLAEVQNPSQEKPMSAAEKELADLRAMGLTKALSKRDATK